MAAFYIALRIMDGRFPGGPYFALVAAPGILFLVCWLLSRSMRNPFDLRTQLPRYVFMDPDLLEAVSLVLNPNEYDPLLEGGVRDCAHRYGAVFIYAGNTIVEIHRCRATRFPTDLAFINESLPLKRDGFCELNCPNVLANFEALLFATKSLLDVLCRYLLSHRTGLNLNGFHKDKRIIGGRVLNALRNTVSLSTLPTRDHLVELIERHKTEWIDDLVGMRDIVAHTGELHNFIGFWTILEGGRTRLYTEQDIHDPVLRSGEKVETYCQNLLALTQEFTENFRDMLFPPEAREAFLSSRGCS